MIAIQPVDGEHHDQTVNGCWPSQIVNVEQLSTKIWYGHKDVN